jgi:hypothetical protein
MKMHNRQRMLKHKDKNVNRMYYEYYNFMYSGTPHVWINWDDEPSGYADNPNNSIFL